MRLGFVLAGIACLLSGCYQGHGDDEDLCGMPVTNNPYVIPKDTAGFVPPMSY